MAAVDDFDEVVEQYHLALNEFFKGNPEPLKSFFSHRDDVTLANPLVGLPARADGSGSLRLWSMPPRSSQLLEALPERQDMTLKLQKQVASSYK